MKWFTSDPHFCHPFVAATRGFIDKEYRDCNNLNELRRELGMQEFNSHVHLADHDEYIVKHINSCVGKDDELYILGDISSSSTASLEHACEYLDQLYVPPSRRHLILGNHDGFGMKPVVSKMLAKRFSTISDTLVVPVENAYGRTMMCLLTHLPQKHHMESYKTPDGAGNACSPKLLKHAIDLPKDDSWIHLHGHTHSKFAFEFGDLRSINVGLDAWGMRPVPEDQLWKLDRFNEQLDEFKKLISEKENQHD